MCIFKYQKARHSESWAELPWVWGWPGLYCEFQASVGYRVRVCPKQQQQKVKSLKRKRTEIAITYFRAPILKIRTGHINLVNIYVYICAENSTASYPPQKSLLAKLPLGEVLANKFGGCSYCPLTNRACTITMYTTPQLTSPDRTNPQSPRL